MSTKKTTAPKTSAAPDELALIRTRARALETELAKVNQSLSDLQIKHSRLLSELQRRASGLPILADLVGVALRMHGKDTAGRTILVAIEKAIAEMRAFNAGDSLPGDAITPESVAARADEVLRRYSNGYPVPVAEALRRNAPAQEKA